MASARRVDPGQVARTIGDAYDAALCAASWESALGRLSEVFGADAATFVVFDTQRPAGGYECAVGVPERLRRDYAAHYWKIDPFRLAAERLQVPPGRAVSDTTLLRDEELFKAEGYNDGMKPHGIRHMLGGGLLRGAHSLAALSLMRSARGGAYSQSDLRAMQGLLPHWRRAVSLHLLLAELDAPWRNLLEVEEAAGRGVIAIDPRDRVVAANGIAETLLRDGSALRLDERRLRARAPAVDRDLQRAIAAARDPAAASPPLPIVAQWAEGGALVLRVVPALQHRFGDGAPRAVMILIEVPDDAAARRIERFVADANLTQAETELLRELVAGRDLAAAALRLGRRYNTARNQLQSILAKTGTHRQAELVAKVLGRGG